MIWFRYEIRLDVRIKQCICPVWKTIPDKWSIILFASICPVYIISSADVSVEHSRVIIVGRLRLEN